MSNRNTESLTTSRVRARVHLFFGLVALVAGIINFLGNPFYPCSMTLIPAAILYFLGIKDGGKLWERKGLRPLLIIVGMGLSSAGLWEVLVMTGWNDILHWFMVLAGLYFGINLLYQKDHNLVIKEFNLSLILGIIGGIGFILFIRAAFLGELFSLSLSLKIPILKEFGSWWLANIIIGFIWGTIFLRLRNRSK